MAKNPAKAAAKSAAAAAPAAVPGTSTAAPAAVAAAASSPQSSTTAAPVQPAPVVPPVQPPAVAPAKKGAAAMRDALFVRSIPASFRRCGFSFDRDGMGIALDLLNEEQLEILENDPDLVAERCQFPADEDA